MDADIGTICFSGEGVQGGLPPPLLLHRVVKQHCTNFAKHKILTKFVWISWNLIKFEENFAKHEINYFAKISRNYEKQKFPQQPCSYTICGLLHKLTSAKTIFCCAAMLLWDEADIYTIVFHSVIYNSVGLTQLSSFPLNENFSGFSGLVPNYALSHYCHITCL